MLINTTLVETFKNKTMDGLYDYTHRECCNQKVRECDNCACYTCKSCEDLNFEEPSPFDDEVCLECYIEEVDQRKSKL